MYTINIKWKCIQSTLNERSMQLTLNEKCIQSTLNENVYNQN